MALGSTNLAKLFGIKLESLSGDFVAYRGGGFFDAQSKVVGVMSRRTGRIDLF